MKRVILDMDDNGAIYGPGDWHIGTAQIGNEHFGTLEEIQQDEREKQSRLMRLLDAGLKPEQIIDLKREGLL